MDRRGRQLHEQKTFIVQVWKIKTLKLIISCGIVKTYKKRKKEKKADRKRLRN